MEVSQRIGKPVGVAPEPKHPVAIDGGYHAIGPEHLGVEQRLFHRNRRAQKLAIPINTFARNAIEPLGDDPPLDHHARDFAGINHQPHAAETKAVGGEFVAVAENVKVNFTILPTRFVDRDIAGAIGDKPQLIDSLQFHQRHAATGLLVNHPHAERFFLRVRGQHHTGEQPHHAKPSQRRAVSHG